MDLVQLFRQYGTPSHRSGDVNICNYVFAGDFVDRGAYSLEVLVTLLCLKVRYHPHVTLLRGNHEDRMCNENYGFLDELKARCRTETYGELYDKYILPVFQALPLAAVVEKRIFVCHGGPGLHVKTLDDVRKIPRPVTNPTHVYSPTDRTQNMIADLLWSDPDDVVGLTVEKDLKYDGRASLPYRWTGAGFNASRGVGSYYGPDVVRAFCVRNGLAMIVRAHECVDNGVRLSDHGDLATVFSAPRYGGGKNGAAIVEISRRLDVHFKAIRPEDANATHWANTKNLDSPRRPTKKVPLYPPLVPGEELDEMSRVSM